MTFLTIQTGGTYYVYKPTALLLFLREYEFVKEAYFDGTLHKLSRKEKDSPIQEACRMVFFNFL
jgi:hypothetical protein